MAQALNCCLRGGRALISSKFRFTDTQIFCRGGWMPSSINNQVREMCVNKETFEVDTLALKRRLEGQGIPSHQAEAITNAITEVTNDAQQYLSALLVTNEQLKLTEKMQDNNHCRFTHEINMLMDNHVSSSESQIQALRADCKKEMTELSCAMGEVTMIRQLELQEKKQDLNEVLSEEISKFKKICRNIDIGLHSINSRAEANNYDVFKYCIGAMIPIFAVTATIIKICV